LLGLQAVLARTFNVADFNFYITANIIGALASVASDLGLTNTVVFTARGDPGNARLIVAWLQRWRAVSAVLFWLIGTVCVVLLRHSLDPADIGTAALLVGSYVGQAYSRYRRAPLLAEQRPVGEAGLEFLDKGLAILGALLPMLLTHQLFYVALGQMIGTVGGYVLVRRAVTMLPRKALIWSRSALQYGVNLSLAVFATQLYARLDYLVLSQFAIPSRAAVYAATYNLVLGFSLVPIALTRVATSHLALGEIGARARRDYLLIALSAGLAGGVAIAAIGPSVVRALFRFDDTQLNALCLILGMAFVFMSINSTIGVLASRIGRERRYLAVVGSALFVNLIACLVLIPSLGMLGAGLATALTEVFVALSWWLTPWRNAPGDLAEPPAVSVVDS
jgi:O-antigen/teichoic acid export membrane protein